MQGLLLDLLDIEWIWRLYPLVAHLPIVLALLLFLHAKWSTALLSVIVSYSLCQMMRWIGLVVSVFCQTPVTVLMIHLALCTMLLFLLDRYCMRSIHALLCQAGKLPYVFGALPLLYYIYEYFMLYTQRRYAEIQAFQELLPTAMLLFFVLFIIVFQRESEKYRLAEQHRFMFEKELDHAKREINTLRTVKEQTAIYRHDMRHHLNMISSLLVAGRPEQAAAYIHRTAGEIEDIVPHRYCEKAEGKGVSMAVKASLPSQICLNDTELCILLSNGLENALRAAASLPESADREIGVFIGDNRNKLLIEIRNPYTGSVVMQDGMPVAQDQKPHYGCRSILSVVQRRNGICRFEASDGIFLLQIAIPLV